MDKRDLPQKRREEADPPRHSARSAAPNHYRMQAPEHPRVTSFDQTIDEHDTYPHIFDAFNQGDGWRSHIAAALSLCPQGFGCILLIIVLYLAQL